MIPRHKAFLFLAVNLALIVGFSVYVNGQTCKVSALIPESLHSFHAKDADKQNQDNGGNGFIFTCKHDTKGGIDLGIGKIFGTNSLGDPLEILIVQAANAELELGFLNVGVYAWWMRIQGYYNGENKPFDFDLGPWPVFHADIKPFYYWDDYPWTKYIFVSHFIIPMVGVSASATTIGFERNFKGAFK